jgi:hypothetical protein
MDISVYEHLLVHGALPLIRDRIGRRDEVEQRLDVQRKIVGADLLGAAKRRGTDGPAR